MIFIYSANQKEAEHFAEQHNLASTDWKYLANEEQLYGQENFTVWACGGWTRRYEAMRIGQMVTSRRGGVFRVL